MTSTLEAAVFELAADEVDASTAIVEVKEDPPNPVLPTGNEIFWSAVFFLLFWMLMKFVLLPPIRAMQKKRAEHLERGDDTKDNVDKEKEKLVQDYEDAMRKVREEASQIVNEARQRAEDYRSQLLSQAESEIVTSRQTNDAQLEAARQEALQALETDVKVLASSAVELILGEAPDDKVVASHMERVKE